MKETTHFLLSVCHMLDIEGEYSDDPRDRGGATKWGISQVFLQHLVSHSLEWRDKLLDGRKVVTKDDVKNLGKEQIIEIYEDQFWLKYRCGEIPWPAGFMYFFMVVNMRPGRATRLLQKAINRSGAYTHEDGLIGPHTIQEAGKCNPVELCKRLGAEGSMAYSDLAKNQPYFEAGWQYRNATALWHAAQLSTW